MPISVKPEYEDLAIRIKVVGVGGAGGNAVGGMVERLSGVDLVAINTDSQALRACPVQKKLQIGKQLTRGMGTGSNPDTGKYAAQENKQQIREMIEGADVVFLTLGLGGGTGTGAGPVIARIARDMGAIVIGFMTLPFVRLGSWRTEIALRGLEEIRPLLHTMIVIPNQKILEVIHEDIPLADAYRRIDEILYQGVAAVSDLATRTGEENLDFADLRTIMEEGGEGLIGVGEVAGENRAARAAEMCLDNPFLRREELVTARNVLISIAAAERGPGTNETEAVFGTIQKLLMPATRIFSGMVIDGSLGDNLKVTVIATGLEKTRVAGEPEKPTGPRRGPPQKGYREKPAREPALFDDGGEFTRPAIDEDSPEGGSGAGERRDET